MEPVVLASNHGCSATPIRVASSASCDAYRETPGTIALCGRPGKAQRIPDDLQRWARAWNIAGAHLANERAAGLRSMTDDDARKIIARIFSGPVPTRIARESGLLERQRLFRQLK